MTPKESRRFIRSLLLIAVLWLASGFGAYFLVHWSHL